MNDTPRNITDNPSAPEVTTPSMRSRGLLVSVAAVLLVGAGIAGGYYLLPGLVGTPSRSAAGPQREEVYTCPMHPQVEQVGPGTCPICFMDLVPKHSSASDNEHGGDADKLVITPRDRVIADVATVEATWQLLTTSITAPATIDFNEGAQRMVSARVSGRIERLYVRETGASVTKGAPLMDIYSPELVAAQREFLVAQESALTLSGPVGNLYRPDTTARAARGHAMVESARRRLVLLGMTSSQIDALDQRREIADRVTVFSPISGIVLRRGVVEGAYVGEGAMLMEVVDMGIVWAMIDAPQDAAARVRVGMPVRLRGYPLGDEVVDATIDRIYPTADATSRTIRLRAPIANRSGLLRAGMYLTAELILPSVDALTVPVSAVIRTGTRDVVYVEVKKNTFEARTVTLGVRSGDHYQIVDGDLHRGDRVVAYGGYLLDSERQLTKPALGSGH